MIERRAVAAGATICAQGDRPREMYVLETGAAEVFTCDRHGAERVIARLGPGATIGELALLSGQPALVAVRAIDDLELLAISQADFERLSDQIPRIAQNLGAILSRRLSQANRAALASERGHVTRLLDQGGPPLLGYALACSVAWHARRSVLMLVLSTKPPDDLVALAAGQGTSYDEVARGGAVPPRRAALLLAPPEGDFAPEALPGTIARLTHRYDYVIVQAPDSFPAELADRTVTLADDEGVIRPGRPGHTMKAWRSGVVVRPDAQGVLHIPPLSLADETALRQGLLPTRTLTGRALGWAARDLAGLKVGLALGAGSIRGFAHFGAWRALERLGLEADYLAGTSIGAFIGSMYALGYSADEGARALLQSGGWAFRPTLPTRSLLSSAGMRQTILEISHERRIEALALPFAVVAADIETGQEAVLRRGLLRTAVLASMSIPGIYPPVRVGDMNLVDGGVINPVPVNVAADLGADVVIAVSLGACAPQPVDDLEAVEARGAAPNLLQVVTRSVEIMQSKIEASAASKATILVEPRFEGVTTLGRRSFAEGERYIDQGEEAIS
ncbi:MAG: cyclic nucleotide-binding domain-containing protein, partial [Chloroflexales bacterium]|nr:cyclic nucleotide-binding domain-containing protein [Chloroflexales bacterium]